MEKGLYTKIGNTVENVFIKFIGFAAVVCLFVVNLAVLARLMKISISWSDEIIKIIFIYIVYIGTALAYRTDGLIGITMLEEYLYKKSNKKPYKYIKLFQHVVIIGFAIFCAFQSYLMAIRQFSYGELTPALEIPAAIATLGFVIGSIIWIYYGIEKIAYYFKLN